MDEVPASIEETPFVHRDIPGDLLHPGFIGMWRDPGDLNATALQMDKEQNVVSDQPTQRQYLYREKVGTRKDRQVRADEVSPSCRTLTLRRRWNTMAL